MRHLNKRKQLGRPAAHRDAVLINLCKSLIQHGRIRTTKAKAKMVQPMIEKLVTKAKTNTLHSKRVVGIKMKSWDSVPKLFEQIGPKFKERAGGYTRIIKLGFRDSDSSEMVYLEFLEEFQSIETKKKEVKKVTTDVKASKPKKEVKAKETRKEADKVESKKKEKSEKKEEKTKK